MKNFKEILVIYPYKSRIYKKASWLFKSNHFIQSLLEGLLNSLLRNSDLKIPKHMFHKTFIEP